MVCASESQITSHNKVIQVTNVIQLIIIINFQRFENTETLAMTLHIPLSAW